MAKKFKDRYVLGEGYPWVCGGGPDYRTVAISDTPGNPKFISLQYPLELWDKELPRYRIVLEKVRKK